MGIMFVLSVFLIRTDAITHKFFLLCSSLKLCILQQLLQAVSTVATLPTLSHFFIISLPATKFEIRTLSGSHCSIVVIFVAQHEFSVNRV